MDLNSSYLNWLTENAPEGFSYSGTHFKWIAAYVQAILNGSIKRARVHMPPRHGKTETITKALAIYLLETRPGIRILITAYNQRLARKFSRAVRNRAISRGIPIALDKFSSDEWYTLNGSMVMAAGVGNVPTGEGFDAIIADDPIKDRAQADSPVFRDNLWEWWTEGLMTRLQPNGFVIGVWTLWHEDDIAGRLDALAKVDPDADQWSVLKLAAIAETGDSLGRKPGEALWPEMWPIDKLINRRASMTQADGQRAFEALYQQNPTPREGAMFVVKNLTIVDSYPEGLTHARAWDSAASIDGDYTCGVKMTHKDKNGIFYVVDVRRRRMNPGERNNFMLATAEDDGTDCRIIVPEDPGSSGKDTAYTWVSLLIGFIVSKVRPDKKKEVRAGPYAAAVENNRVRLVRGSWNAEYIEELRQFPNGKNDDQVDASSDCFMSVSRGRTIEIS